MDTTDGRPDAIGETIAPAAIIALAVALRLMGLGKGLWLDEYSSIDVAFTPDVVPRLRSYDHPPLYFLLLRAWSHLGTAEPVLRLLSVVLGVATLVLLMRWVARTSRTASLVTGLIGATLPILVRYAQEIRHYSLLLLFTTLAFTAASRVVRRPASWRGYLGVGLSLSLVVGTHAIGVFVIGSIVVFLLLGGDGWRRLDRAKLAVALALPIVAFVLVHFVFQANAQHPTRADWWMPAPSTVVWVKAAGKNLGIPQLLDIAAVTSLGTISYALIFFPAVVLAVLCLFGGDWRGSLPFLGAAVAYCAQIVAYSILVIPLTVERLFLPALIPLLAFVGVHVAGMQPRWCRRLSVAILMVWCSLWTASWVRGGAWQPIEPWRALATTIEPQWQVGAIVICYPGFVCGPTLYYLSERWKTAARLPVWNDVSSIEPHLAQLLEQRPRGRPVVVVSRMPFPAGNSSRQLDATLQSHFGPPAFSQQFGPLSVRTYHTGSVALTDSTSPRN